MDASRVRAREQRAGAKDTQAWEAAGAGGMPGRAGSFWPAQSISSPQPEVGQGKRALLLAWCGLEAVEAGFEGCRALLVSAWGFAGPPAAPCERRELLS